MKYDFTSHLDRHGMDAVAVDTAGDPWGIAPKGTTKEGFDQIPMWVADMNFATVPTVTERIINRAQHPAFGYFAPREEFYDAIINWHKDIHHVEGLKKEHIGYENGVVGGILSALQTLCSMGDNVLIHAPTYAGFVDDLGRAGYNLVLSQMVKDEEGIWRMDFQEMDRLIKKYKIHAAVFCSPHNPTGRVWEKWEVEGAMKVFEENEVTVISDEIWSDIIFAGYTHTPTQSVSEYARMNTVALYAPSKTFNLAGLQASYHIIYNRVLRERVERVAAVGMYNSMNVLSMHALIGAYTPEGQEWLGELKEVLEKNATFAYNYVNDHFEGVEVSKTQGTYMMFLDCEEWCKNHNMTLDELMEKGVEVGILWQDGRQMNAKCSIRLNLASPFDRIEEAFKRMDQYVFNAK